MDKDLYDLPPRELKKIPTVCGSLREALASLDKDRAFLKAGGVFNDDFIDSYIELKMDGGHALRDDAAPGRVRHVLLGLSLFRVSSPAAVAAAPSRPEPSGSGFFVPGRAEIFEAAGTPAEQARLQVSPAHSAPTSRSP